MHIKKIIIQGFKTYKNTTVIDLLSPNLNVVVGRNGSGKSNFFAAIRFVLSDAYTHMSREERQGLIHESTGSVLSAYVEIVFDNSDKRLPVAKEEVAIRRTIGLKKDDYSIDGRSASKSDIMNLLESAGFSRSNPYYIVPQGRITSLTNSKDSERLQLLKEVSGAKIFEMKLKESNKEMKNSKFKKQRIDETLKAIQERLDDLQIESDDLKEYHSLEKSKKIYEFNILDRELADLNEQIEQINSDYSQLLTQSQKDLEELDSRDKLQLELTQSINELTATLNISQLEKNQLQADYKQVYDKLSEKKIQLDQLRATNISADEQEAAIKNNIGKYKDLISSKEKEILNLKPKLRDLQVQESEIKSELEIYVSRQRALYARKNRFSKFNSKEERDSWLQEQIEANSQEFITKNSDLIELKKLVANKEYEIGQIESQISEFNESITGEKFQSDIEKIQVNISDCRTKISNLLDKRKQLWRDEIRYKSIADSLNNDLEIASQTVNKTMDRAQVRGLTAVNSIAKKLGLTESVYGPVGDLFHVSEKYKTAAEVIAGNSLFHVVVDNDKTASLIMEELTRTKSGRVTFLPLNRIHSPEINYPDSSIEECIPLIKKIKTEFPKIFPALKHIFGNTIVVANLEVGSQISKKYSLNCITLDGDRYNTGGTLSGGYRDYRSSRIDSLRLQKKKKNELQENEDFLQKCKSEIELIGPELTEVNNELQHLLKSLDKKLASQEPIKLDIDRLQDTKYGLLQEKNSMDSKINSLISITENLSNKISQYKEELKSEMNLNSQELEEIEHLKNKITESENQLDALVIQLQEVESTIVKYESDLNDNYKPYLANLEKKQFEFKVNNKNMEFDELEDEISRLDIQYDTLQGKLDEAVDVCNKLQKTIEDSNAVLKKHVKQQNLLVKKLAKFSESSERSLAKKVVLKNRHDELQKKIRELGVLPEEAYQQEKYEKYTSDELLKKLNEVNDELVKYSHINKKAIEQYTTFTKQRDDLVARRSELDTSEESIEELIANLEEQKEEAITKSFNQIANSFKKIFDKLVPNGNGKLILQKRGTEATQQDEDIENYDGVSISVSFNSKHDEQQRIEQLSGGQKSLCAIALILAIQSCDPAPFYLFDEIDANLDTQYRSAVANIVSTLAKNAQFICTTFRPEMVNVAEKFYGVMFNNKVSSVSEIDKDESLSFVESQEHA